MTPPSEPVRHQVVRRSVVRRPGQGLELSVHEFVDDGAEPSGVSVVLLHGFMDAGATWDRVAVRLCAVGHAVYAPDQRGFGASDRVPAGGYYHFPDYVADLRRVVDDIAPARLILVGHSMGGTVACLFAGCFPERVERLVLMEGVGPPAMPAQMGRLRFQRWLADLDRATDSRPMTVAEALRRLRRAHPGLDDELLASRAELLTRADAEGLSWSYDPLHRTTSPLRFDVEVFKHFLAAISCPVLFVGGGPQGWHPPDEAARLECLPTAPTRLELDGAGHMMHWTRPEQVADAIVAHIAEADPNHESR